MCLPVCHSPAHGITFDSFHLSGRSMAPMEALFMVIADVMAGKSERMRSGEKNFLLLHINTVRLRCPLSITLQSGLNALHLPIISPFYSLYVKCTELFKHSIHRTWTSDALNLKHSFENWFFVSTVIEESKIHWLIIILACACIRRWTGPGLNPEFTIRVRWDRPDDRTFQQV